LLLSLLTASPSLVVKWLALLLNRDNEPAQWVPSWAGVSS
jgi:hypothetical protein